MSIYKPPVNSQLKTASVWLYFLFLSGLVFFIHHITGYYTDEFKGFEVLDDDSTIGTTVLSIFYAFMTFLFFIIYYLRAIDFNRTVKGDFLAAWILEGGDWQLFKESELYEEVSSKTGCAIGIGVALILVGAIITIFSDMRHPGLYMGIMTGVAVFIVAIVFIRSYFIKKNLNINYGLIYLNKSYLIYNNFMHQFKGFGSRLDDMEVIESEGKTGLGIHYSFSSRTGRIHRFVVVPIPKAEFDRFGELVEYIKSRSTNIFKKIDLIGNKVAIDEVKSSGLKFVTAIFLGLATSYAGAYLIVNNELNNFKQKRAEYKIREEKNREKIRKYNEKIYSKLPISAADFTQSDGFQWNYEYQADNTDYIMNIVMKDGSIILANDKNDGTTELRRIDIDGKEQWKKSVKRDFGSAYYFSNNLVRFGDEFGFTCIQTENDNVRMKLLVFEGNGNQKKTIDIDIKASGRLIYPWVESRDENSFVYYALAEDEKMNFIALIDKDGKILEQKTIGDVAQKDGFLFGWGDAAELHFYDKGIVQTYKNIVNIFDLDGNQTNRIVIPDTTLTPLQNPASDKSGNLYLLYNRPFQEIDEYQMATHPMMFLEYDFSSSTDSIKIISINKKGESDISESIYFRLHHHQQLKYLANNKLLVIARSQISKSEYVKIAGLIYDIKSKEIKKLIYGKRNQNLVFYDAKIFEKSVIIIAKLTEKSSKKHKFLVFRDELKN